MIVSILLAAGFVGLLIYLNSSETTQEKRYMEEQRRTGRDKHQMLDFMQSVMKQHYSNYTYAVGNNKIPISRFHVNYYPYIVCFNSRDIIIISYKKQNGMLLCTNILPIDWNYMHLKYHIRSKGMRLSFRLGKTKMQMNVSRVVISSGAENLDTPLGVVQEQEVDQLIRYLPHYQEIFSDVLPEGKNKTNHTVKDILQKREHRTVFAEKNVPVQRMDRRMTPKKFVLALVAICIGTGILLMELVLLLAGAWNQRIAALQEPIDIFSESCNITQLEEMDVVSSTIPILYGKYDYTYDDYVSDVAYYYILPIHTTEQVYYMGIRETKGRKDKFRNLSVQTDFDIKPPQINPPSFSDESDEKERPDKKEPIMIEGFLCRMDENQYERYLAWLRNAGYLKGTEEQCLPFYIEERDITGYKTSCVNGLLGIAMSILLITGGTAVILSWRNRRRNQTLIIIDGKSYTKERLASVNQLICNVELMQAIQELSQITGLNLAAAEKAVRYWEVY